ncbi:MAG: hypothetical protein U0M33_01100 [Lachnospiraceae bacterium]|nr:hypothetical protein [Lachnospiraceae bacterium]
MKKRLLGMLLVGTMVVSGAMTAVAEGKMIAIVPWSMAETFAVDFSHEAEEEIEARGWNSYCWIRLSCIRRW